MAPAPAGSTRTVPGARVDVDADVGHVGGHDPPA
jgi:hypothetical protein